MMKSFPCTIVQNGRGMTGIFRQFVTNPPLFLLGRISTVETLIFREKNGPAYRPAPPLT